MCEPVRGLRAVAFVREFQGDLEEPLSDVSPLDGVVQDVIDVLHEKLRPVVNAQCMRRSRLAARLAKSSGIQVGAR
jgi:hypothetical protein